MGSLDLSRAGSGKRLVYAPVRHHDFVNYDDPEYITENAEVAGGPTWHGVVWAFTTGDAGNWHPLTWLSHMVDIQLYGMNAGRHHITSVILHTISAVLLFWLLYQLTGAVWQSAFAAGLFSLHPLHVESVAWVAERKDVLSTMFGMLTLLFYVRYVRKPGLRAYVPVFLFFALGLMSKPMLVTLPFVLLLLDFWPLGRLQTRQLVREKMPLFALSAASSIVTFLVQQRGEMVAKLDAVPAANRFGNAVVA